MTETGKIDPAEKVKEKQEKERVLDDVQSFDINNLTISDFKAVPPRQARMVHPFDGYPAKDKIEVGRNRSKHKIMESATHIVGLSLFAIPPQDISGRGVSIIDSKTKEERRVDLKTYHSRVIPTGPHNNEDVVFDRQLVLKDGNKLYYAIVRNHATRAQLIFHYDSKNGRVEVDKRYLLLDDDQSSRLRALFHQIINPKLRRERMAQEVAGEIESTEESLKQIPTE